jgi:hypothetical protein
LGDLAGKESTGNAITAFHYLNKGRYAALIDRDSPKRLFWLRYCALQRDFVYKMTPPVANLMSGYVCEFFRARG